MRLEKMEESPWNSLETIKILISIITPIIGGIIAWKLAKVGKTLNKKQWTGQKIIEKRLAFYDEVVPLLNDLYCYYKMVGNWKEPTPPEIIEKKRFLDKQFYIYAHIFKNDILGMYQPFIHNCFKTHNDWGLDAKIMMNLTKRVVLPNWNPEWNALFAEEDMVDKKLFENSYFDLLNFIRSELEL